MSRKSQEEVTTEYWSKLSNQSSPSMKKDTNKGGPHNKEENEVEDLVEEWLLHQNTEIRSRWRIHCRCFPGISQATRNQTSLKGRIEQSLTWLEALWSTYKPSVSHLSIFGSIAYIKVPEVRRTKLEDKGEKCILVGYAFLNGFLEEEIYVEQPPGYVKKSKEDKYGKMQSCYNSSRNRIRIKKE
ncbi:hypothetical protein ACOSQ2_017307 [Xanthoceras sorbifolium]